MRKKVLSVFLALVMTLCLAPTVAFAAGTDTGKAIQLVDSGIAANIGGGQADNIYFGSYQQSNLGSTEPETGTENVDWVKSEKATKKGYGPYYSIEPIKWRVLSNAGGQLFLLSDQNLDVFQYHTESESVTWEKSTMRSWLNGYDASSNTGGDNGIDYTGDNFLYTAFSAEERAAIAETEVFNDDNPDYGTDGGNNPTDKIFFLSIAEANNESYFPNGDESRVATNTTYVAGGGKIGSGDMYDVGVADFWWLRSPSSIAYHAAVVSLYGSLGRDPVDYSSLPVRPSFNLNLNSVLLTSASGTSKSSAIVSDSVQVGAATGSEWKLTLKDDRKTVKLTDNQAVSMAADGTVTVPYTYTDTATADTENVNQISVMITDKAYTESNAKILYYGALQGTLGVNGTGTFVLPSALQGQALGTDYHVYILAEHTTNTNATDYSSTPAEITNVSITGAAITGIDTPTATQALDTSASCATAGVTTSTPTVTWNPTATTAGYNTSYMASVTLSPSTGYTFADSVAATVNENAATSVTRNQNGTLNVTFAFAATAKDKLTSITMPSQINVANGTEYDTIVAGLPSQVNIVTEGKTVTTASVTWNTQTPAGGSYNPSKLEEQNITLNGTVTCPDTVDSNNVPLTTTIAIKIQHGHGFDGAEWKYDTTNHWHECTVANCDKSDGYITDSGEHTDTAVKDHKCDTCGKVLSTCADNDDDHLCDVCGAKLSDHTGGEANCTSGEICKICKNEYGTKNPRNHTDLNHFDRNEATVNKEGNKEYWYCDGCEKYYSDETAENEIKLKDIVIAKLAPLIIKGDGQTVTEGEKKALEFTSNAAFEDFISVEVDGKTIDESNYTVKSGSTIVTLNADYVATLSACEHTLGIVSQSGTAKAKFTVNKKAEETTTTTDKPTTNDETKSPQTGDNSKIFLWLALLFVSGGAVTATAFGRKKRRAE